MTQDEELSAEETRENLADVLEEKARNHESVTDATVTEVDIGADGHPQDFTVRVEREEDEQAPSEHSDKSHSDHVGREPTGEVPQQVDREDLEIPGWEDLREDWINSSERDEPLEKGLNEANSFSRSEISPTRGQQVPDMHSSTENGELQDAVRESVRQVATLAGGTLLFGLIALYVIWYGITTGALSVAATGVLLLGVIFYHLTRLRS